MRTHMVGDGKRGFCGAHVPNTERNHCADYGCFEWLHWLCAAFCGSWGQRGRHRKCLWNDIVLSNMSISLLNIVIGSYLSYSAHFWALPWFGIIQIAEWIHGAELCCLWWTHWVCTTSYWGRCWHRCSRQSALCLWLFRCCNGYYLFQYVLITFWIQSFILRRRFAVSSLPHISRNIFPCSRVVWNLCWCLCMMASGGLWSVLRVFYLCSMQDRSSALIQASQGGHTACVRLLIDADTDNSVKNKVRWCHWSSSSALHCRKSLSAHEEVVLRCLLLHDLTLCTFVAHIFFTREVQAIMWEYYQNRFRAMDNFRVFFMFLLSLGLLHFWDPKFETQGLPVSWNTLFCLMSCLLISWRRGRVRHSNQLQNGDTALNMAAHGGHTDCVRLLLESGANKDVKNNVRDMIFFSLLSTMYVQRQECMNTSDADRRPRRKFPTHKSPFIFRRKEHFSYVQYEISLDRICRPICSR